MILDEVEQPGQPDVDSVGKLLSVRELQDALRLVRTGDSPSHPTPVPTPPDLVEDTTIHPTTSTPTTRSIARRPMQDRIREMAGEISSVHADESADDLAAESTPKVAPLGVSAGRRRRRGRAVTKRGAGAPKQLPRRFVGTAAVEVAARLSDPAWPHLHAEFVAAGGGTGASTVVTAVGSLAAALSRYPIVAATTRVDGGRSLLRRIHGEPDGMGGDEWAAAGSDLTQLQPTATGLLVLDGPISEQTSRTIATSAGLLLARGVVDPAGWEGSDGLVVVVARADGAGVDALLRAVEIASRRPDLVVLVDTGRFRTADRRAAAALAETIGPVCTIPWSATLQRCPMRIDRLEKSTATAIAEVTYQLTELIHPSISASEQRN